MNTSYIARTGQPPSGRTRGRVSMQNTGSTAAAPTSPENSVFDLQNWQQVQGNDDHTKLKKAIDTILADKASKEKENDSDGTTAV